MIGIYFSKTCSFLHLILQVDSTTAYATSNGQSDSSIIQGQPPIFYSPEKPDGSVSILGDGKNPSPSFTKKTVKPDGGGQ